MVNFSSDAVDADWSVIFDSWNKQQTAYIKYRQERFSFMIQALGDHLGTHFTFIDLGCGPGSLTQQILDAFPKAQALAVDTDPVLLAIAEHVLARFGDRVNIIDADLRAANWVEKLPTKKIEAAVSTTALHWLNPEQLLAMYSDVAALMPEGGIILNGDNLAYDVTDRVSRKLAKIAQDRARKQLLAQSGVLNWDEWWEAMEKEPALRTAFAERAVKQQAADDLYGTRHQSRLSNLSLHALALRHAGCTEVNTIWQCFENRVLMGILDHQHDPNVSLSK